MYCSPAFFYSRMTKNLLISSDSCCYVCGRLFSDTLPKELHHIVPEYLGGTDGPLAPLCEAHHKLVHKIARIFIRSRHKVSDKDKEALRKIYEETSSSFGSESIPRLERLASIIKDADDRFASDTNKILSAEIEYTKEQAQMMDELKQKLGLKSRRELLMRILADAYVMHFPLKRK